MKHYSNKIALIRNSRGIYCLDTSIGCATGMQTEGGCYNDCYAARSAKLYGYDFATTILRHFASERHKRQVIQQINKVRLDFVRIGCSGDPSENWQHTFEVLKVISKSNKQIVIITKHWTLLTDEQLQLLTRMNICINTSVSALDNPEQIAKNVEQYTRIKPFCRSVLRIVSCDFSLGNETGHKLFKVQSELFKNEDTLDTVFRPSKNNPLITNGVINVTKGLFNGKKQLMSKFNKKTFTGKCSNCHQMCGVTMKNENHVYQNKRPLTKQLSFFGS